MYLFLIQDIVMSGLEQSVNFDRAIDYYDATRGFPNGVAAKVGAFIADVTQLDTQSDLLEVGIGTGRIAVPLAPHVASIAGVDISSGMMSKIHEKQNTDTIHLAKANAEHLPFSTQSFDAVLITHVLHLVSQPEQVLNEIQRVTKSSGKFIHCRNSYRNDGVMADINAAWNEHTKRASKGPKRWNTIDTLITNAAFTLVREEGYEFPYENRLANYVKAIEERHWSSTWFLDDETHKRGLDAVYAVIDEQLNGDIHAISEGVGTFLVQIYNIS